MISMLCLGNGTSASMLPCIPSSDLSNSKRIKLNYSPGHSFGTLGNARQRQKIPRITYPAIYAREGSPIPRKNDKNNRSAKRTAGASLAFACAIGIITAGFKMNPKAIAGPRELFQKSSPPPVIIHAFGGKAALESFLDVPASLASDEVPPPDMKFRLPINPSIEEIHTVKKHAVQLMKYGKSEEAEEFLENAHKLYQNEPEAAYNVEMALVEILICVGKYEEALNCSCLNENHRLLSDSRFPLYKAIIHTMLDDKEEATRYWGEYTEFVEAGFDPRSHFM